MKKLKKVAFIETSVKYGRELLHGILRYSRIHGPWAFPWIFYRQEVWHRVFGYKHPVPKEIQKWRPDGIITLDSKNIEEFRKWNIPVFISAGKNQPISGRNYILTDDLAIGKIAAEHLLERGFRNFGYVGHDAMFWSRQRCEGFVARIAEAGFRTNILKRPKSRTHLSWYKDEANIANWLMGLPKPIGIMACNDDRALQIIEGCAEAKIEIPYEVAIIGVDNDELICEGSNPPLSSITLDVEKAGFQAGELLDRMMAGEKLPPQTVVIHPIRVVTRRSTDIVAVEDKLVGQALNFIHQNANHPIQAGDVTKALNVSRNCLNNRFMKILRRSVYNEIKRFRADLISQMLETDLSISDIALCLGFNNANHIARYYKQKTGISPLEYRRRHILK